MSRPIRNYDQLVLFTSTRADNRYQVFQAQDIERVRLIQLFLGIGFALDEMRRWPPCFAGDRLPDDTPQQDMAAFYFPKVVLLDAQITALQQLRNKLTMEARRFNAQAGHSHH